MIFISYRHSDAGGHANNLHHRLGQWFDADALFYDQSSIDMGVVFPAEIEAALAQAAAVLVLIGPDWLAEINRRAGQPEIDYVRHEIALALKAGKPVIPICLGGAAPFPIAALHADLQTELAAFPLHNAHIFQGNTADWDNLFVRLRDKLATFPGVPAPRFRPPTGTERHRQLIDHQLSPHFRDPHGLLPQLHRQLEASHGTALVARAALYGMGGVGKTQLALKYSLDYPDCYAGLWWFRAETETTLQLDAEACCQAVGAPIGQGEKPSAALKRWLAAQPAPWLLVFDNAEHPDDLRPHLPQGGPHRILVTSRDPNWRGLLGQALELEVWSPEEGAAFLAARLPELKSDELRALSADLGGLPLALEQAAGYVDSTGCTVAAYRKLLADADTEGPILDEGRAATGYERTVLATLSLAFDKLNPAAAQVLCLLAYAAPEAFPLRALREAADVLPAELANATANDLSWNRLIAELRGYGLAALSSLPAWAPNSGDTDDEPALHLHRLTQQALRTRLANPARDGAALQAVLRAASPADARLPDHWPRYAALLPHIVHLDRHADAEWLDRRSHGWLLDRIATYLRYGPALYEEAVGWFRRAQDINRTDLGEEHPNTLTSMGNLAGALMAQGDLADALDLQKSVLAESRRILGEEHPGTLIFMNNLASALKAQGDLAGALELEKSALAIRRRVLGEEHLDTLTAMNNLANTLHAQGDLAGALELQKPALAIRRRVLGDTHPGTIVSAWNLFTTALTLEDATTAQEVFEPFLLPLLQADPADLPASSQTIRTHLLNSRTAIEALTGLGFQALPPSS